MYLLESKMQKLTLLKVKKKENFLLNFISPTKTKIINLKFLPTRIWITWEEMAIMIIRKLNTFPNLQKVENNLRI